MFVYKKCILICVYGICLCISVHIYILCMYIFVYFRTHAYVKHLFFFVCRVFKYVLHLLTFVVYQSVIVGSTWGCCIENGQSALKCLLFAMCRSPMLVNTSWKTLYCGLQIYFFVLIFENNNFSCTIHFMLIPNGLQ